MSRRFIAKPEVRVSGSFMVKTDDRINKLTTSCTECKRTLIKLLNDVPISYCTHCNMIYIITD
jgi:hypothetical protein